MHSPSSTPGSAICSSASSRMAMERVHEPIDALAEVEAEHALQYKLLAEAERLLQAGQADAARAALQQLYEYSEVHFGSEQLLMRAASYPGYHAHEREHGELLIALSAMLQESNNVTIAAIRRWLTSHIHHSDQAYLDFVRS